jgi:uncharacterized protein YegP (UPF0339 family)
VGNEQYYGVDRPRWAAFLGLEPEELPTYRDWPQLLAPLRRILRWLADPEIPELSDYLRASRARDLLEQIRPDFNYAGVSVEFGRTIDDAWSALTETIERGLAALMAHVEPAGRLAQWVSAADDARPSRATLTVYQDRSDAWRWRLQAANGQVVALSPGAFSSRRAALDAARFLADRAPELAAEIYPDAGRAFRWRISAVNGELLAVSAEGYSTRSNARRAAEVVRGSVREALRT